MAETLKPCPFCGSEKLTVSDYGEEVSCVTCKDCLAEGGHWGDSDSTSPDEAIALWNKRAPIGGLS